MGDLSNAVGFLIVLVLDLGMGLTLLIGLAVLIVIGRH